MKIHEYQGRDLLSSFNIAVPPGTMITSAGDAARAYREVTGGNSGALAVVKAQVHAGGRGAAGGCEAVPHGG